MRRCATRSRTSRPRSRRSSPPTSPTSTVPSSPWSTSRRPSRERFLPAIRGIRGPCDGSTWRSSRPTRRPASRPFDGEEGERAAKLYERVFLGYGDDSIAQVGGAHVACEWVSNILTKLLQRGRLAAYLEQSTRYIPYDKPLPGRGGYRYLPRRGARSRVRRGDGRALCDLLPLAGPGRGSGRRSAGPAAMANRRGRGSARSAPRRSTCCAACCRRRRSATSASTPPARPTSSCCCG